MEPEVHQETYEPSKGRFVSKAEESVTSIKLGVDVGFFYAPYVPFSLSTDGLIKPQDLPLAPTEHVTITVTKPRGPITKVLSSIPDGIHLDYMEYSNDLKSFNSRDGVDFGYLNSALGRIDKGSLTIIGGQTGSGLSTLLIGIASEYEAANPTKLYAVCSNEVGSAFIECARYRGVTLKNAVLIDTTKQDDLETLDALSPEVLFVDDLILADSRSKHTEHYSVVANAARFIRELASKYDMAVIATVRTPKLKQDENGVGQLPFGVVVIADSIFKVHPSVLSVIKLHNTKYRHGRVGSLDMMEWDRVDKQFIVYKKLQRPPKVLTPSPLSGIQSIGRSLRKTDVNALIIEELADIAREYNISCTSANNSGLDFELN